MGHSFSAPNPLPSLFSLLFCCSFLLPQRLLEALGNLAADPESPSFQQMLEIIKASNNVKYDENGEMEVDLTDLDSDTLWKLHSMAKHLQLL